MRTYLRAIRVPKMSNGAERRDTPGKDFMNLNRHNSVINGDNPDRKFISRFI